MTAWCATTAARWISWTPTTPIVNQRLAEHYGIPGVYGTTFRKVELDPALHRGGLLGQGAILTVTSYNNRTSVVLRGKWILENLLAARAAAAAAAMVPPWMTPRTARP